MLYDPLEPPTAASPVLKTFLNAFGIHAEDTPTATLCRVASAFARLPFENLTKILKDAQAGTPAEARRHPREVISDHLELGAGGTCFALTSTLLHLVRALGWEAQPLLADRRYGADTHSGLLIWLDGRPHLLDPGYLIVRPVPIPSQGELRIPTSFNDVLLTARDGGRKVDLHTEQQGQKTYRLTFKTDPADRGAFLRAWDNSFDNEMLTYPVLSRVADGRQLYLQQNRWLARSRTAVERAELDPQQLPQVIAREFGIAPDLAARALAVLQRKGEGHGRTPAA